MRKQVIHSGRAIIEPYFDNIDPLYTLDKHPVMKYYNFTTSGGNVSFMPTWCSLLVDLQPETNIKSWAIMERSCNLDIGDYNEFILFASLPGHALISMEAIIDGKKQLLLKNHPGFEATDELKIPFSGKHLTWFSFSFSLEKELPSRLELRWLAVNNKKKEKNYHKETSVYPKEWNSFIIEDDQISVVPQFNLFFDRKDLDQIRETVMKPPFNKAYKLLQKVAYGYAALNPDYASKHLHTVHNKRVKKENMVPEKMIGKFVPWADMRWNSNHEMEFPRINDQMEQIAFVGLIDQNLELIRFSLRMALSIAHCEYWTESIMGVMPGIEWHHRSFTETCYLKACALVLDWAGSLLTEHGKRVILDAMAMKGLPRVESDFKRHEYIRSMNQGMHFNMGRMLAYMCLSAYYPRYGENIELCKKDLHEMIDNYVLEDGGALEGPFYWNYTFEEVIQQIFLLSRYENKAFDEMASPSLIKTGKFGLGMLSFKNNHTDLLPINDSHWDQSYHIGACGAFYLITKNREWKELYQRMLQTKNLKPQTFLFIIAHLLGSEPSKKANQHSLKVFPKTGQVDAIYNKVHFHYITGPVYKGHYHQDKGSFILELGEDVLLIDRGVLAYSHPKAVETGYAFNHNLLVPYDMNHNFLKQPSHAEGGRLIEAKMKDGKLYIKSDDTLAWEKGVFVTCTRSIITDFKDFIIIDEGRTAQMVQGLSFRLHTKKPVIQEEDGFIITGKHHKLKVSPINYTPSEIGFKIDGTDSELNDVNVLWFNVKVSGYYRFETKVTIV